MSAHQEPRPKTGPTPQFKGWTKPGPIPKGMLTSPPSLEDLAPASSGEAITLDAISGHYRIYQLRNGHRFSTDDVLTAWYGTSHAPCARRVLDLGSGIGSVGMTAAWRLPFSQFVTVEAQAISVELARRSAKFNDLEGRYEIRQGDFRERSVLPLPATTDEAFDLVLGSPPYWPESDGVTSEHPQKLACRFELRGSIADYCQTAAEQLAPGGWFACVFPIQPEHQEKRVFAGAEAAGLSVVRWRPIIFREGEAPLIGLFAMVKSTDLPEKFRSSPWREPALIIRTKTGEIHPEYSMVKLSFGFPPG
jgi:tRNA1Val (adenine37-N6)-methyltransferase